MFSRRFHFFVVASLAMLVSANNVCPPEKTTTVVKISTVTATATKTVTATQTQTDIQTVTDVQTVTATNTLTDIQTETDIITDTLTATTTDLQTTTDLVIITDVQISTITLPPVTVTDTVTATTTSPVVTQTITPDQCNTGSIQCCSSVETADSSAVQTLLKLLGIVLDDTNIQVGLTCSPITGSGTGSGSSCTQSPVCCENDDFSGAIAIGCSPININL